MLLSSVAGDVITRDEFLNTLWGEDVYVTHRTVDTHVSTTSQKTGSRSKQPGLSLWAFAVWAIDLTRAC